MTASNNNDINDYFRNVAKIFLVIISALCILSIMCCCKTYKNSSSVNDETVDRKYDSVVNSISFDRKWFENYIQTNFDSEESVKIVIYDTSLPVCIETNRPPVVAEIEKNKKTGASVVESAISSEVCTDSVSEKSVQEESFEKHEKQEEVVSKSVSTLKLYLFIGVMIVSVCIALWGKHLIQDGVMFLLNKIFR